METRDSEAGLKEEDERPCPLSGLLASPEEAVPAMMAESALPAGVETPGEVHLEPIPWQSRQSPGEAQPMETELDQEPSSQGSPKLDDVRGPEPDTICASPLLKSEPDPDPNFDPEDETRGESLFPCPHCERHFATKQGLERHTHIHVSANLHTHTFKCRYCGKSFGSQAGRRRHERRHENGPKKKPDSLAGTTSSLSPSLQTDSVNSDLTTVPGRLLIVGPRISGVNPECSGEGEKREGEKQDSVAEVERAFLLDENGESKELHPCKYCRKAFSSHTNMRRHQRRIHERHLLPKGVRRKGSLLQEVQPSPQQPASTPGGSLGTNPQLVYRPSREVEDEGDREEEYMVDISSNISENLSLYIDGKILSTGTVSGCEVIEVDAGSAALLGLDAVIISQALKVETATCTAREAPSITPQTAKRRTSTPPLLPKIKTESESSSSSTSSSSSSSSSSSLAVPVLPSAMDGLAFPKEKTVYLSPKLKQLLQTQDGLRLTPPAPRLSVTSLSSGSGRFKRRTASPPHSPSQDGPMPKGQSSEAGAPFALKVPKLETHGRSPAWSRDERDSTSPPRMDWSSLTGGSPCNQQPLDLSGTPGKKNVGSGLGQGEAVLDLSVHRKSSQEESKGGPATQPLSRKRKPNTSMLEKVLMKEYSGLELAEEEEVPGEQPVQSPVAEPGTNTSADPSPDMPLSFPEGLGAESTAPSTSPHPSPPSLNPPSPCTTTPGSPTPPPPVLPTVPSPHPLSGSPYCQPCGSPEHRPLPVLFPETSLDSREKCSPPSETGSITLRSDTLPDERSPNSDPSVDSEDQEHLAQPLNTQTDPKTSTAESLTASESVSAPAVGPSPQPGDSSMILLSDSCGENVPEPTASLQSPIGCRAAPEAVQRCSVNPHLDGVLNQEVKGEVQQQILSPPLSPRPPVLEASLPSDPMLPTESLPPLMLPPLLTTAVIKEELDHKSEPADAAGDTPEKPLEPEAFCRSFVCNVCEEPFCSMKELRWHITTHAQDWPFKCEFCVQLFGDATALLEHRSTLHSVGKIYVCCACNKEFAFLCNLQQHQGDLHPGQGSTHTVVENGKLRPQNFTDPTRASAEPLLSTTDSKPSAEGDAVGALAIMGDKDDNEEAKDKEELDDPTEELYTTIKIMASEGGKRKAPDVRLGINQHYPSFKPPPFPYHNRTPAGSVASATNFTTHNIPQTFSTAIRCTKCGKSFDNMPELHKHILSCANASDKRRYTPKKNPIPLSQAIKPLNGALSPTATASVAHATLRWMGQPKRLSFGPESAGKPKLSALNKKKNQLVQRALSQRNRSAAPSQAEEEQGVHMCPHCQREFTYRGSLNKHMAVSCPMKPAVKKDGGDDPVTQDRNGHLRSARRTADSEIQQQVSDLGSRTLGKTRTRSSGPAEDTSNMSLKPQPARGKPTPSQAQPKRPASSLTAAIPLGKKSKAAPAQQQSPPSSPIPPGGPAQCPPAGRMQRGNKEVLPRKVSEALSPPLQSKKEERFAPKARERVGGPVTRSLQLANVPPTASETTEDPANQEPKEHKDTLLKLVRPHRQGTVLTLMDVNGQPAERADGNIQSCGQEGAVLWSHAAHRLGQLGSCEVLGVEPNQHSVHDPLWDEVPEEVQEEVRLLKQIKDLEKSLGGGAEELAVTKLWAQLAQRDQELHRAKEALLAMKADQQRLKAEKEDLEKQMQELYATLESREEQLTDFIRNYEQHRKESEDAVKVLAQEKDLLEEEKRESRRESKEAEECASVLHSKLQLRDNRSKDLEAELSIAKQSLASLTKDVPKRHSLATPTELVAHGTQEWTRQAELPLTAAIRQSQLTLFHGQVVRNSLCHLRQSSVISDTSATEGDRSSSPSDTSSPHHRTHSPCNSTEDLEEQRCKKKREVLSLGSLSRVFSRVKQHRSVDPVGTQFQTEEVLRTVLIEQEGVLNSKPLGYVSSSIADLDPILTDHFWSSFIRHYLPSLQVRQKWYATRADLTDDKVVMATGDPLTRALWPFGRVIKVHPSVDDQVRSADVKIKDQIYTQPDARLVVLPVIPDGEDRNPASTTPPQNT
ncbi:hypothetical protein AAFF_G00394750 [Aldrovandia affinis]|uniref:C2H2-type domain-containing protein n=1 Tax=Aldrovandia affinis TaxID=143900 RepID=A0AAD7WKT7_9TELE|nr:hypothetical protein AAFF_G00394750 [Aldrovandia affinis]